MRCLIGAYHPEGVRVGSACLITDEVATAGVYPPTWNRDADKFNNIDERTERHEKRARVALSEFRLDF